MSESPGRIIPRCGLGPGVKDCQGQSCLARPGIAGLDGKTLGQPEGATIGVVLKYFGSLG